MSEVNYQKVAKGGFGLIYQSTLYTSEDHLLLRKASTFTNSYTRLFYRDIQAIYLRGKMGYKLLLALWGILMVTAMLLARLAPSFEAAIFPGVMAVLFVYLVTKTAVGGKLCEVTLETAAQSVRLPALGNERKALRVMDDLKQRIEAVQGVVTETDLTGDFAPAARRAVQPQIHLAQTNVWHWLTNVGWLATAALLALAYAQRISQVMGGIIYLLLLSCLITAMVAASLNLRERRERTPLEWLTYVGIGFLLLRAGIYYFFIILMSVDNGDLGTDGFVQMLLNGNIFASPEFKVWFGIEAVLAMVFGLLGMLLAVIGSSSQQER